MTPNTYGEPIPAAAAPPAPAPAEAAPAAPALPAPGTLARYTRWDDYARPARERTGVILVTSHEQADDGTPRVRGIDLGYEDEAGTFDPRSLT
jgi:hypothetical protein